MPASSLTSRSNILCGKRRCHALLRNGIRSHSLIEGLDFSAAASRDDGLGHGGLLRLSFCHTNQLCTKKSIHISKKDRQMRAALLVLILSIAFASPGFAKPKCAPRGQCAKDWWKGDQCACYIHNGKVRH